MANGAARQKIGGDPVKVVEVTAKRFGLTETSRQSMLRHLIDGGDLSRWGLSNAVTRASQDVEDYEEATAMERAGGAILELPPSDWGLQAARWD